MKTKLPRQEFLEALGAVAAVAGGRTTKPVLGCVHIASEGESLELSAGDGEVGLHVRVGAFTVGEPGELVVSAERLLAIVREMPDAEVQLESDERHCVIRGVGSEFRIFLYPPGEFPTIPTFDTDPDIVLDGHCLRRMIELTSYAAAREMTRYAINGILWEKRGKRLRLVATDGRRLACASGTVGRSGPEDFDIIVPLKAMSVFERVFAPQRSGEEWPVDIAVTPNQLLLRSGGCVLVTVLVEGTFPKYEEVIPKASNKVAEANRLELYSAVRRAALLTSEESRAIRMKFSSDGLTVSARSAEEGEARVELPVKYEGDALEIGFNPAFIAEVLKALDCENVRLELQDSFRPGVISGSDKGAFLYVIMPVSL